MGDQAMPERVADAEQIGLSTREARAAVQPRDAGNWAAKVERLAVERRDGVRGTNVAGRRLTGPVQGFGKMWEKTYSLNAGHVTRADPGQRSREPVAPRPELGEVRLPGRDR